MPKDRVGEFLKRSVPQRKPDRIEEFLSAPVIAQPAPAPPASAPGFLENIGIGARRALLGAADAGRVFEDALNAANRGDFGPLREIAELAARGGVPLAAAVASGGAAAVPAFQTSQAVQGPRIAELTREREERMAAQPELFSREAAAERARLDALAALDPSLAGKITRRGTEGALTALPATVAGSATGGSVPAMAGIAGLQAMSQPETLIPSVALAAAPIPLGRVIAPIVRRIRAGRAAPEIPIVPTATPAVEPPAISTETALPGVEAPPAIPTPAPVAETATAPSTVLQSAVQKLGTDSAEEIGEMIANANRRFNKTITVPGAKARPITPAERQSAIEDFNRIRTLTKEEHDALAEVLPERTFAPVTPMLIAGEPTARAISDIPLSEPSAQLDANLRQLKAFFGSEGIVRESKIAAAVGASVDDTGVVRTADLGLETVPVPVRPPDAIPVARRVSVDDISLGRDTLSKGRMFGVQESLKGGVKAEQKGVPLKQQVEPITVAPDPNRPGKFIVEDDGNHRIALLKLQGVTDDIPVKSFETPAQTASIRAAVGPRAGEIAPMEAVIKEQLDRVSRPRAARNMESLEVESMAGAKQVPLFDHSQRSRLRKALNLAADIYQIPRSMMASADLSAPFRQGAILTLPPSRWGKAGKAAVEMFRALVPDRPTSIKGGIKAQFQPKTERFQQMVDAIASDPDAMAGQNAGLHLGTQGQGPLRKAEEEFVSRTADRIPIVRESQQAYTAYLDNIRLNTFKSYKRAIDAQGFSLEQTTRAYKAAADWINIASGRGSFGPRLDRAMDALNFFVFAPRLLASRIQVLNPLTYLRNVGTAEGRVVLKMQMSEMAQFTGMVGGTLLLAKAAGFKVGTNPEKPDSLRISLGNYHYDGLAGLQPVMRLIYNVSADAARAARGEEPEEGKTALDVGARFLRGKLAPVPSFFVDFLSRKTFEGKPFNLTDAAVERLSPLMWTDFVEAYQREGLGGPLKMSPQVGGFGVQYYEPKPIDTAIEQRPELLNELTRLQVRIRDPRRKPDESDESYNGRQEAIANLYSRFGVSLMSSRSYANQSEVFKQEAFNLLHERILNAVNTRDRRIGQFQPEVIIGAVRRAEFQGKLRQRRIAGRPPL